MLRMIMTAAAAALILGALGCGAGREERPMRSVATDVPERLKDYARVELEVPWDLLPESERAAIEKLYRAGRIMDEIFYVQVAAENPKWLAEIEQCGDEKLLRFFRINFGPWDRLAENEPFYGGKVKPDGANFYPEDMTKDEFESWLDEHPDDRTAFESNFTVIRRGEDGGLHAVPYSQEYAGKLEEAAGLLEEAAGLTANESLAAFLRSRAEAFLGNDYFQSDMDWMDVGDNLLDVTIGPYEVYEDNLFAYKAAFEAFICVRDPEESAKLDGLKGYLVEMERNLPIEDRHKNFDRGLSSPISVADEVFSGGDTKAGPQTLAFNLPNDERVREAKGSKKVMLRNICHAKFDKILAPIAEVEIVTEQLPHVTFEAYFNHILLHEFTHGLGPGRITLADGTETTVNRELQDAYSTLEEAKADIGGQYNIYYLIDEGFYPPALEKQTAVTFLAGFFRSVRFGAESAHGRANMIIFNYFKEKGAYKQEPATGKWYVDFSLSRGVARELFSELLMLQALGDYEGSKAFIARYGEMGEDVLESLSRLEEVPVDIEPVFAIEKRFAVN